MPLYGSPSTCGKASDPSPPGCALAAGRATRGSVSWSRTTGIDHTAYGRQHPIGRTGWLYDPELVQEDDDDDDELERAMVNVRNERKYYMPKLDVLVWL